MRHHKYYLALILLLIISGCSTPEERFEQQLDKAMDEPFEYSEFYDDGFSVLYPIWPNAEQGDDNVELSVSRGYCSVTINSETMDSKQWYNMILDAVEKQNSTIIISNERELHLKYSNFYQNLTLLSDNRVYECNNNAIIVSIMCIEQADEKMQYMHDKIFDSAACEGKQEDIIKTKQDVEVVYTDYDDDDFSIKSPDWNELPEETEQRILGKTKGVCSLIVDKHNALPKDIFDWVQKAIEEKEDQDLLDSSESDGTYYFTYQLPYQENTITATTKVFYCNYQSYLTQVLCVDELINDEYEEIRDSILESSRCSKKYDIPTPEKIEKEKQEIKQKEPEVIEEIEDEIVKTDVGQEFGIDEEMIVYFVNNNLFFTKILKDFPKANLVIEDKDGNRELKLRVSISNEGKITLLEDGEYSDADVTLKIPLRDALNLFNNAQNLNPLTLLGFVANVRTEPPEIKNQVIQKVLRGEYS